MSSRRGKLRDDKVLAERNELKDEVARKNKEIEKLKAALVSAREHLSKAIECLEEPTAAAVANGHKTESPITPDQDTNPMRKFGPGGVLKRFPTFVDDLESPESHRPLKRSSKSVP